MGHLIYIEVYMISNSDLTVYHRVNGEWIRKNYTNIWWYSKQNANSDKGYNNNNSVEIRISYDLNPDIEDFSFGDILVKGTLDQDITRQQDLDVKDVYNIIGISNNTFGRRPHIHISGE